MGCFLAGLPEACPAGRGSARTFRAPSSRCAQVISLIFWTLTLVVLFKYVVVVLQADDRGEGGTFALYTLIW